MVLWYRLVGKKAILINGGAREYKLDVHLVAWAFLEYGREASMREWILWVSEQVFKMVYF